VKKVFEDYRERFIKRSEILVLLDIRKTRFSELWKRYKEDPEKFHIDYSRSEPTRKSDPEIDEIIANELRAEKAVIEAPNNKIKDFNFRAIEADILRNHGKKISYGTIRNKAILWKFHDPKKEKNTLYTEFERGGFGSLFQHDTSIHQWSPYMKKFYLILTIDDHTRYFVYAKFFQEESSMNHIYAVEETVMTYGIPVEYYVDRHAIFTGYNRTSVWNNIEKKKEEFEVQFRIVCEKVGIHIINAQSSNAKGKIERPFRYLQDRLVRRMAKEEVRDMFHAQAILDEEVEFYNFSKVHSTTKEIPCDRFNRSHEEKRSVARPFNAKGQDYRDVFCLHYTRSVDKFGRISYLGYKIYLPERVRYKKKVAIKVRIQNSFHKLRIFVDSYCVKSIDVQAKKKVPN